MEQHSRTSSASLSNNNFSWFNRSILDGVTTQFGPAPQDRFTVYLTQDAVIDLHEGTYKQIPSEAFGLLMGRVYKDDVGIFTVIERVFYARKLDAGPGHVHLSEVAMHELRFQAAYKHPAMDFVGWTHSHDRASKYSEIDYQEQKNWDFPYHVGILTFMEGVQGIASTWAMMYRGPTAQSLRFVLDATPILRRNNKLPPFTQEKSRIQEPEPKTQEPTIPQEVSKIEEILTGQPKLRPQESAISQNTGTIQPKLRPQEPVSELKEQSPEELRVRRFSQVVNKKAILSPILMLAIVIIGVVLGNFLMLSLQPVMPISSSTDLLWDCNPQSGKVSLSVTCTGPVGPNIQGWIWDLGDGTTMQKSTITHIYRTSGIYKITLVVISSTNQHSGTYGINAGSVTVTVQMGP